MKISLSIATLLAIIIAFIFWPRPPSPDISISDQATPEEEPAKPLQGDQLLAQHGSENTTAWDDVQALHQVGSVFALLNRHINSIHFSDNEGLTHHLLGHSKIATPLISKNSRLIGKNSANKAILIDRWGSPYIIHLQSARRIEFRTPGPDRIPYTQDDTLWPKDLNTP